MDYYLKFWYTNDKENIEENKYLIMLNLEKKDLLRLSKKDRKVKKYMEELEKVNRDPKFIEFVSYEEDQRRRENTRLRKATEQGSLLKSKEIAKSLLKENISINIISKTTGLSIDEITELQESL